LLLQNDFSDPETTQRRTLRGDWNIADGMATCMQDDELYKKHKDHGPIIFYDLPHESCTVSFQFKAEGAKT